LGDLIGFKRYRLLNTPIYCYLAHSTGSYFKKLYVTSVISIPSANGALTHVASADVNDDGFDDLIFATKALSDTATTSQVYVCFGSAIGISGTPEIWADLSPEDEVAAAADLDGDGASDLVVNKTGKADPILEIWLSDREKGFIRTSDNWMDSLDDFEDAKIDFIGVGNIGLGNWQ